MRPDAPPYDVRLAGLDRIAVTEGRATVARNARLKFARHTAELAVEPRKPLECRHVLRGLLGQVVPGGRDAPTR